ncbi:uncharacterized protein [Malus domestica]|uniref:uncharacterized protein n=1 Tax=Malus domestica TaxID=3750 RepID=UPI003976C1CD
MAAPSFKVEGVLGMLTIKLRDDNFAKWAFQFQSVLRGYKLFGHFDGTTPCPSKFVVDSDNGITREITVAYTEWETIDMALLSLLLATLTDEAMEYVIRINHLKTELHMIQKGSDTIDRYLWRLKHIRDQLSAVGESISDNDIMIAGLAGLPKEYGVIRTVILAREFTLTLKEFRALLLGAEREIEGEMNIIAQNMSALYIQGSSSSSTTGSNSNIGSSSSASSSNSHSHAHIPAITAGTISAVPYDSNGHNASGPQFSNAQFGSFGNNYRGNNNYRGGNNYRNHNGFRGRGYGSGSSGGSRQLGNGNNNWSGIVDTRTTVVIECQDKKTKEIVYQGKSRPEELFVWIFPMSNKSDVFTIFVKYYKFVLNQFGTTIKSLQTDGNGIAERKHRHILETAITLLSASGLPSELCSPYLVLYKKVPDIQSLKIFGSAVFHWLRPYNCHLYREIQILQDHIALYLNQVVLPFTSTSTNINSVIIDVDQNCIQTRLKIGTIHRKSYVGCLVFLPQLQSLHPDDLSTAAFSTNLDTHLTGGFSFLADITDCEEPRTFKTASLKQEWQIAMQEEFNALKTQGTWILVPPPSNRSVIGNTSLFVKVDGGDIILLLLYVDDIILTGSNSVKIQSVIDDLAGVFDLKDMGRLTYFLGLHIQYRDDGSLFISHTKYAKDVLHKVAMDNCKSTSIPSKPHTQILAGEGTALSDPSHYRSIVGALQYLTFTRLDIAHLVNMICQFMAQPTDLYMFLVKRILRYIQGTIGYGLQYTKSKEFNITAYSDSDWGADINTRRSITCFVFYLGVNPISWQSKKQSIVSRSYTEAEYKALAHCAADVFWIRSVFKDIHQYISVPPSLHCDNLSALALSSNPVFH